MPLWAERERVLKYVDAYRDSKLAKRLLETLQKRPYGSRTLRLMEICGTHTVAMFRLGLRQLLPSPLQLISGPGCPVCVTATEDVDRALWIARQTGAIVATFGDFMRVPGSRSSLLTERSRGGSVRMVYASFDALQVARDNPHREVVFLGIGFETTAPTVAAAILQASREGIENFSVLSMHKLLPPAMKALLDGEGTDLHGFICPGHVSTVIGAAAYEEIAARYEIPCVVTGFEALDLLQGLHLLVDQVLAGEARVVNQYSRAVNWGGNPAAQRLLAQVFEPADAPWRGLGIIPRSGLKIRKEWQLLDAAERFAIPPMESREPPGCRCSEVLRGTVTPPQCGLFGKACTPETPVGPCMVSSEGTCGAYHQYHQED